MPYVMNKIQAVTINITIGPDDLKWIESLNNKSACFSNNPIGFIIKVVHVKQQ